MAVDGIQVSISETTSKAPAKYYHLWVLSSSGNGLFRRQRCFTSRAAANNAGKHNGYNVYQKPNGCPDVVMKCRETYLWRERYLCRSRWLYQFKEDDRQLRLAFPKKEGSNEQGRD